MFKKIFKILKKTFRIKRKPARRTKKILRRRTRLKRRISRSRRKSPTRKKRPLARRLKRQALKQPVLIGEITHYFPKVRAAVVKLKKPLSVGEPVWIKGKSTNFRQTAASMQIEKKPVEKARPGQEIGLEVLREVRPGDCVFSPMIK